MRWLLIIPFIIAPVWCAESIGLLVLAPSAQLTGVDVSHHQKRIEWDSVVTKENIHFAFVKATEGRDFRDSMFCTNWDALGRLGVKRGAYHFFRGYGCGYDQAAHFLSSVDMVTGDLPPVLDVETLDGSSPEALATELHIWLNTIELHLAVRPIIYSNQNFFDRYLADKGFDKYPLWIARYSEDAPALTDNYYWTFWQFTNKGCVEGISEKVDLNIFSGTPEMLDEMSYRKVALP
jgi:lysozyme